MIITKWHSLLSGHELDAPSLCTCTGRQSQLFPSGWIKYHTLNSMAALANPYWQLTRIHDHS